MPSAPNILSALLLLLPAAHSPPPSAKLTVAATTTMHLSSAEGPLYTSAGLKLAEVSIQRHAAENLSLECTVGTLQIHQSVRREDWRMETIQSRPTAVIKLYVVFPSTSPITALPHGEQTVACRVVNPTQHEEARAQTQGVYGTIAQLPDLQFENERPIELVDCASRARAAADSPVCLHVRHKPVYAYATPHAACTIDGQSFEAEERDSPGLEIHVGALRPGSHTVSCALSLQNGVSFETDVTNNQMQTQLNVITSKREWRYDLALEQVDTRATPAPYHLPAPTFANGHPMPSGCMGPPMAMGHSVMVTVRNAGSEFVRRVEIVCRTAQSELRADAYFLQPQQSERVAVTGPTIVGSSPDIECSVTAKDNEITETSLANNTARARLTFTNQ